MQVRGVRTMLCFHSLSVSLCPLMVDVKFFCDGQKPLRKKKNYFTQMYSPRKYYTIRRVKTRVFLKRIVVVVVVRHEVRRQDTTNQKAKVQK